MTPRIATDDDPRITAEAVAATRRYPATKFLRKAMRRPVPRDALGWSYVLDSPEGIDAFVDTSGRVCLSLNKYYSSAVDAMHGILAVMHPDVRCTLETYRDPGCIMHLRRGNQHLFKIQRQTCYILRLEDVRERPGPIAEGVYYYSAEDEYMRCTADHVEAIRAEDEYMRGKQRKREAQEQEQAAKRVCT